MNNKNKLTKKLIVFFVCAACALTVLALPAAAAGEVAGLTDMMNNTKGILWEVLQFVGVIAIVVGIAMFLLDLFGQGVMQKIACIGMILGGIAMYNMESIVTMILGG